MGEIVFVMKLSDEETKKKATTLGVARRHGRRHKRRVRPYGEVIDPAFPVLDCGELVDLPSCLHLSNDWLLWFACSCSDSGGLLRLRHHLQVRSRLGHLHRHRCQVQEWQGGCFVAMKLQHCLACSSLFFEPPV